MSGLEPGGAGQVEGKGGGGESGSVFRHQDRSFHHGAISFAVLLVVCRPLVLETACDGDRGRGAGMRE